MDSPLWSLDWLRIKPRGYVDRSGVQWILTEQAGFWDAPESRSDVVDRPNAHGAYVGPVHYGTRVVTMTGRAYCDDARALRRARADVAGLCASETETYALSCESEIGTLSCDVKRDGAILTQPVPFLNTNAFEFSLQVMAPDPRKYAARTQTMRATLPQAATGDGLDFAAKRSSFDPYQGLAFPLRFGESNSTGFLRLTNNGTAPTAPTYTLHGPLDAPTLTATTGERTSQLTYNASIAAGEFVTIDPTAPTVLLMGTASRRWLLNPADFAGFHVPPASAATRSAGVLNVGLTHLGPTTVDGYVTAEFRDAYY